MTELLSKLFIKNRACPEDPTVRKSYGTLASIVGVAVNFILAGIKFVAGMLASSVAITADALNNLSDAGSSVITFFSFKISSKPADKGHPFGHARMEYIASMVVSLLILLVGAEMLLDSGRTLIDPASAEPIDVSLVTIIILSVSVLMKLWLAVFYRKIGKKINSGVVRASGTDSLSDAISTLAVLTSSIIIKFTGWQIIDSIVGIAVSVMIIVAGAKILNETKNSLLGEAPVEETVTKIRGIVAEYPDIIGMHDLMVHNYGPSHFIASLHAEVDGGEDIYRLHDMIDNVERRIKYELDIACTIHMDPIVTNDETVNSLKEMLLGVISEEQLSVEIHDFRVVIGETHTNMIFDVVLPFESPLCECEIVERISGAVAAKSENCYCVITVDRE